MEAGSPCGALLPAGSGRWAGRGGSMRRPAATGTPAPSKPDASSIARSRGEVVSRRLDPRPSSPTGHVREGSR